MSDSSMIQANNLPVQATDFTIQMWVTDEEGNPVHELKELPKLVHSWNYVLAPNPFVDDEETEEDFGIEDEEDLEALSLHHPEPEEEDETDEEEVDDYRIDTSDEPYRELQLVHSITGAAFQEMMHNVFRRKEQPAVSVAITYFTRLEGVAHPIFRHVFIGDIFWRDELGSVRSDGHEQVSPSPLRMVTNMDVFGSETYVDPTDEVAQVIARLNQEYSNRSTH